MGNKNTKFFDDLSKGATWSAGVAFKRSNPLPLDRYSVFETKALAEAYATSNAVAYPGQVIAVAEGNKMVAYVLAENTAGDALVLQQIGIIPTGDDKTINVTEDGVISLLAADTEIFKKDAEGNPTEEKEINAGAQLVLQADGTLKWVKPDTTTVEGLSTAVTDLQGRMTTAETDIDALEKAVAAEVERATGAEEDLAEAIAAEAKARADADAGLSTRIGYASKEATDGEEAVEASGVYVAIEAEVARAKAAEEALGDRIDGLGDVATEDYVANAIKDFATDTEVADAVAAEAALREAADTDLNELITAVSDKVDAFLTGEGTEAALDSLQELIKYIDEHDDVDIAGILEDIQAIENKLKDIDTTVVDYVTAAINALKIGDYAKAADLTQLAERVTTLEGKVDVDKVSTAIAAAEGRAAEDATSKVNTAHAAAVKHTNDTLVDYYKKSETNSKEEIATAIETAVSVEADRADKAEKANAANIEAIAKDYLKAADKQELQGAIDLKANQTALEGAVQSLEGKIALKADQTALDATDAIVATKADASALESAVSTLEGKITTAQNQANKGVSDAATAQAAAEAAQGTANTNAANIEELDKLLFGREAVEGQEAIVGLNSKVASNTTRIGTLEGTVAEHTTAIGNNTTAAANAQAQADEALRVANLKTTMAEVEAKGYAVAETVNAEIAKKTTMAEVEAKGYAVAETVNTDLAKKADKETTYTKDDIDGKVNTINGEIAKKADADKVYTKEEVDATVGGINTEVGKKANKTYVDEELGKRDTAISDTLDAAKKYVDDKNLDQYTTEQEVKDIVDTVVAAAVEGDALEGLTDLVEYINTHGGEATEMAKAIEALEAKPGLDKVGTVTSIATGDGLTGGTITDNGTIGLSDTTKASLEKANTAVQPADLGTMAKEVATDYVKKSEATGYTDILTKTEAATTYQPVGNYAPADINTGVMSVTSLHDALVVTTGENGAITINFADEIILNGGGANVAAE